MKFNGNVVLTAALMATLSLMVACAPAKRGTKFADRSGPNSGGTEADRFFGKQSTSDETKAFEQSIIMIDAMIEESDDSRIGRDKLAKIAAERSENKVSGLPEPKAEERGAEAEVDENPGLAAERSKDRRANSLITVRVTLEGIGALDYMEFNDEFGSKNNLVELLPANADCASKVANFLSVRAACADASCSQLAIQLVDERGEKKLFVNKFVERIGSPEGSPVKVAKYKAFVSALEVTDEKVKPAKPELACKKADAEVEAAKLAEEEKVKEEEAAKAKKEDDKKKTDDTEVDAIEALAKD